MQTKYKIALARLAWRSARLGRSLAGKGMTGRFRRGGVNWQLDLNQGIDFSIYLLGAFEVPTVRFYRKMVATGEVVIDIGANIGAHTLPFARCVGASGEVHAFEPTHFAFQKLLANVDLNPDLRPSIVCNQTLLAAPGASELPDAIYSSWPLDPAGEVHPKHLGELQHLTGASIEALDAYVTRKRLRRVDWIKIDVDGNETTVLEGAVETIRRFQPKFIMELSPYVCREAGHDFAALVGTLRSAGYEFLDLETGGTLPGSAADLDRMIPDGAGLNAFLKPGSVGGAR